MKLSNQTLHELGMIDDTTEDESTFERMVGDFDVERPKKYKNKRKYSAEKTAQYRARRLAKKAREERLQREKEAMDALAFQQLYNRLDNGEPLS
tara:strand:- start:1624 stop:1905 length:282 start_codon:yes stop_codon:yes gene_type:complete